MPTYCYRRKDNDELVEITMSIEEMFRRQNRDGSIILDDGDEAIRDFVAEHEGFRNMPGLWEDGLYSDGAGINPDQIPEAMEHASKHGFRQDQVHFDGEGRCFFDSRSTRKRYLQTIGLHDNDGGYGD